jgi:hypothetical protein
MSNLVVVVRAVILATLFAPAIAYAQAADPAGDRAAVDKVMHDYFEAYSRGDMAVVMNFISVPFTVSGPKGFMTFTKADEALDWYTKVHDTVVKQGFAKTEWLDLGVKLLGQAYAITGGTFVRYKTDGNELNRSGGTYLLNKVDGVWKIGVLLNYPIKDAFKPE